MNTLFYIPFFLFIIAAYFYYQQKSRKKDLFYREERLDYVKDHPELAKEHSENLSQGLPWVGMDSETLISLFGEPRRKRVLDQSLTRVIWSYADLFVYLNEGRVAEWKSR